MIDTTKIFPVNISIIKTLRSDGWELASRVYETWADGVFEWVLRVSLQVRSKKRSQPQKSASRRDGKKGGERKGSYLSLPVNWGGIQTIGVFCVVIRSLERVQFSCSGSSSSD